MSDARGDGDANAHVEDILTTLQRWGANIWRRIRNMLSFNRRVVRRRWGIRIIDTLHSHQGELLRANVNYVREPVASTSTNFISTTVECPSPAQDSSNSTTAGSAAAEPNEIQYLHPGPSNLPQDVVESDAYIRSSSDSKDDDDNLTAEDSKGSESEQESGPSGLHEDMELGCNLPRHTILEKAIARNRRIRAQCRDRKTIGRRFAPRRLAPPLECIITPHVVPSCSTSQHVDPTEDQPAAESPGIEENDGNVSNDVPAPKKEEPDQAEAGGAESDQNKNA